MSSPKVKLFGKDGGKWKIDVHSIDNMVEKMTNNPR